VGKLTDVLNTGVGNLVDADLAKESARLQALQVQQQLGAQALSIANSAPQIILSLFRGG
jgi:flagellin